MNKPIIVNDDDVNISCAWAKAFLKFIKQSNNNSSLLVSINNFEEDMEVREALDNELSTSDKYPISISAMVVFPYEVWIRRGRPPYKDFREWCLKRFIPRLKARDKNNRRGIYFERMMAYQYYDEKNKLCMKDQLSYIIDWWKKEEFQNGRRPRRSGLQVACFDPRQDQIERQYLIFPCLQQLGFTYDKTGLAINAFYPTQFIIDRAYGNYLGLCHLGMFMAYQLGTKFIRMNCFTSCCQLGNNLTKTRLRSLIDLLHKKVNC